MKTSVEINGYLITIEENDGLVSVRAEKDEEVVEEFTLETAEGQESQESQEDEEGTEIKGFGEFGQGEEDFEGEEGAQEEEEENEEGAQEEEEEESALESFQHFINKKK